ncbi:flagellar export protein FliJ [Thalassomonas viridans]|uniref:Flagellar FliJ protein n=1 Tax=Thalassomonas viridans TaxID=137584 RepID=A0AAE9YZW0_9GAMM|nr:flagellar export protein FliJ [Thalassomonas viridans]WDE03978.1 flagellar export protein FliJ [Thalassomonas viridans]
MAMRQLDTLLKFEQDKEVSAAQKLQAAELEYQQNQQRLKGVQDYRLEYMKRLSQRSLSGIDSATYSHFHGFIAKLDHAAEQVQLAIKQAKSMLELRKKQWLAQRQKVKAVEHLKEQQLKKLAVLADKREQKMFDEIATQQFVRRNF